MNSLELLRKLYEDEIDVESLKQDLDEETRQELTHLLEAKTALEALPRKRPSTDVINAVVAGAAQTKGRPSALTLILTNRMLQRLAAAAVVVVAVGVGYLTLRTDAVVPLDRVNQAVGSSEEAAGGPEEGQSGGKDGFKAMAEAESRIEPGITSPAPSESRQLADLVEEKPAPQTAPTSRDEANEGARNTFRRDFDLDGAMAEAEPLQEHVGDDMVGLAGGEALFADSALKGGEDDSELLTWENEEEAFRTFFWQVQALNERSSAEDWEEAVPLEGSFERLEKQEAGDGWLETRGKR